MEISQTTSATTAITPAATIKDIIARQAGVKLDAVTDDKLLEELGLDSLDRVELVMYCEDELMINIPDAAVDPLDGSTTVGQFVTMVLAVKDAT